MPAAMGNYGLSPRNVIVNNFPDPHRSPHMNGYASAHTSPFVGGLGAMDDLAGMRGRQLVDPIVDGAMPYGGAPLFHSPGGMGMRGHSPGRMGMGIGGSPGGMGMGSMPMPARAFVLTDQDYQDGCVVRTCHPRVRTRARHPADGPQSRSSAQSSRTRPS